MGGNDDLLLVRRRLFRGGTVLVDLLVARPDGQVMALVPIDSGPDGCCVTRLAGHPGGGFAIAREGTLRRLGAGGGDGWTLELDGLFVRDVVGRPDGSFDVLASNSLVRVGSDGDILRAWRLPAEITSIGLVRGVPAGATLIVRLNPIGATPRRTGLVHVDDDGIVTWSLQFVRPELVGQDLTATAGDAGTLVSLNGDATGLGAPWVARIGPAGEMPQGCDAWAPIDLGLFSDATILGTTTPTPGLGWRDQGDWRWRGSSLETASPDVTRIAECEDALPNVVGGTDGPLRVFAPAPGAALRLRFPPASGALAYNVVGGAIGSRVAQPIACAIASWTDVGDGEIELSADVPSGSWFVVTASNEHGEGPAGRDSFGFERSMKAHWTACGAFR